MQVKRETVYNEIFRISASQTNQPEWLKELRTEALSFFSEVGFPSVEDEEWKYTNVAPIARETFQYDFKVESKISEETISKFVLEEAKKSFLVFLNGRFRPEFSNAQSLADVKIASFTQAFNDPDLQKTLQQKLGSLVDYRKNGFTALNTAFIEEGLFLFIPRDKIIESPIQLVFLTENEKIAFPRCLIVMEEGSEATLIESYNRNQEGKYFTNAVIEISIANEAKLKHYRVQRESHNSFHVTTTCAEVQCGSVYDSTNITLGAKLSRHDVIAIFKAEGGQAFVDGLYLVSGEQHSDTHSVIDHVFPNCLSRQNYKGIVDGKARAVFNGKIFVRENAHGTDAQQSNKNLLLSNEARVDTKPQLEIFNDDVRCSHGATVGQLEEEEIFYLMSRGLHHSLAENLLTYGFAEEIVNKIEVDSLKSQLDEALLNRLKAKL
ncbi:MAG: Fe-S cluster assembly protein SufD [Acidobacteria bacterium]|jgi:Fe-S cluster assembly protein SufD|nr:MAG: Fe-S cluster assembly protein SufD [Acidobacteriota bacterium]GIU83006.1 MAG: Fe-S cluster assembly protein SufD [Pyrinomonadaceae bacterium]